MKRYVLIYAERFPSAFGNPVLLIHRTKEDWQKGLFNLPGGHIEDGETPIQAAVRELKEETGLVADEIDSTILGELKGIFGSVIVVHCLYMGWKNREALTHCNEGKIVQMQFCDAQYDPRLIANLQLIIPLCQACLTGWVITQGDTPSELQTQLKVC